MAPVDYEIMLFFEDHPIQATPKVIAANIDYDRQYVGKRCSALANAGLLKTVGTGLYTLSEIGSSYLEGELETGTLEEPDS
ncbi:homolog to phage PhiH1 repressor protein [Natrialba magadii ATCC 43099]|uniref:Phage PhiH1 repressor protein n=2 Tax=Natrialba magadii TaxID=13769 RepID=D3SWF3_NATMM|nr:homolog to phage PhiH1 repressor protein [Natrialba magadii ATCC 43099]ELY33801.1 phage PhiH1 repressor protein [Natrialba magadii ATCC 43099]